MKIFVIALQKEDSIGSASFEVIEAGKSLGGELHSLILTGKESSLAESLVSVGGGKVLNVKHQALSFFNEEVYSKVISALIAKYSPDVVLGPATFYGKALFSRLAALNGGRMVSDVTALNNSGEKLEVIRPSYGGNVLATVGPNDSGPFFVTIRPKIFAPAATGEGEVVIENVDESCFEAGTEVMEVVASSGTTRNLSEADLIVSAGRGIKAAENMKLVEELADSLGAAVGASRAIVDADWVPYSIQVGQTGRVVNPKLYVAVGISGAIQHLVGMQTARTIVAVNKDKDAPIFNIATYGIVGDLFEILPALTAKFSSELSN